MFENKIVRQCEFCFDQREELGVQVAGEFGIDLGDTEIGFGQHHLRIGDQGTQEVPFGEHFTHDRTVELLARPGEAGAQAIPSRQHATALRPGENPGDCAQVLDPGARAP